jgi:phosphomethylpyrimidine synthase
VLDPVINMTRKANTAISLGASFRSANIFDSFDACQIQEFKLQKAIADYIYERGVGVVVKGPGHSTPKKLRQIAVHYKEMEYPIMPLGPIPTDVAIGQDHISSAIGATLFGLDDCADILTSVTREEHTGKIPTTESSIEAIRATKIATHIIDLDKLNDHSRDKAIIEYRANYQTCVFDKKNSGCSRCAHSCPLINDAIKDPLI